MEENRTKEFEDTFHKDLASYLEAHDLIDKHFPEAPDIEALWATLGESYLPELQPCPRPLQDDDPQH